MLSGRFGIIHYSLFFFCLHKRLESYVTYLQYVCCTQQIMRCLKETYRHSVLNLVKNEHGYLKNFKIYAIVRKAHDIVMAFL